MAVYIFKRFFSMSLVVFAVSVVTFLLIHLAPGDPRILMAMSRFGNDVTLEQIAWIGEEMGLSAPIHTQYIIWLKHFFSGDLGHSIRTDQTVASELFMRLSATLQLGLAGFILSMLIALPVGIYAAIKKNSIFDHVTMMISVLLISLPGFWLALLLILLFSVKLSILPVCGRGTISHMVLPVTVLALGMAAPTTRLVRTCKLEILKQDYILAARCKGLSEKIIIFRHALRNALLPIVTYSGIKLTRIFQTTVIIETIFAWEGLGKRMVDSCFARDFPMIQGCILVIAGAFVIINFTVDMLYLYVDPRIRLVTEGRTL